MPPERANLEPEAKIKTEVAVTKRLPEPAPRPALRNAKLISVAVDVRNRIIQQQYELTSDDGARTAHRHVVIRDGRSSVSTQDGETSAETEEGFEGAAASIIAFLESQVAYAETLGLV